MMSLDEAAKAIGASMVYGAPGQPGARATNGSARFASVSTDSRTLPAGALFVALRGERFDGHEFIAAARERGAAAAMVDERFDAGREASGLPLLRTGDTRLGLGRLAAHWRGRFAIPLVAVAGSNGKTTVKEMIAAILRAHYGDDATLATAGNLNNDIGLPLTLLRLREQHRAAVVEIGMNHPGETAYLGGIARPTVALVNNAQREHQEFMQGVDAVAREHGALFTVLGETGVAVINADDAHAAYWRGLVQPRQVRDFGIDSTAAVTGRCARSGFGSDIVISAPEGQASFTLQVPGAHNARNAVAAAAAATAAGASLASVERGLSGFAAVKGRMQSKRSRSGALLIDDTYNANPDSVLAAIDVLRELPGTRVLVLGDMGEVGAQGAAFHREIGRHAREAGIQRLFAVGELAAQAIAEFGVGGAWYAQVEGLLEDLEPAAIPGASVLVKGSRFMRMERVVAALVGEEKT